MCALTNRAAYYMLHMKGIPYLFVHLFNPDIYFLPSLNILIQLPLQGMPFQRCPVW